MKNNTKNGFSKVFISIGIALALIIIGIIVVKSRPIKQEFVKVIRGDINQQVSVTGRVKAVSSADLGLEKSGRISWVAVKVGDHVVAGQSLLAIENGDLFADLERSRANVKKEEAKFAELKRGTRLEEIKVKESEVANSEISLEDAKKGLIDSIADSYTRSDDAVHNKIDVLFSNPRSVNPGLNFISSNAQLNDEVESSRVKIEGVLSSWETVARSLSVNDEIGASITLSKSSSEKTRLFLEQVGLVVNGLTPTTALTQSTIDTYKSNISTARTNINTGISNLTSADEKFRNASASLATAEKELSLKRAGSTAEEIAIEEASLEYARAEVKSSEALLAKTIVRAPFSGVVVKLDARVGEILSSNSTVATLISQGKFKIEANVPEADIAKISIGNKAVVTLDAYGSDIFFPAIISTIEPGETVIDGVPTYKVTFEFVSQDARIKSGMTANVDINVSTKKGVLLIPQKVITTKDSVKTVTVVREGVSWEVVVKTGARGDAGNVEILSGVSEGESVLIPVIK